MASASTSSSRLFYMDKGKRSSSTSTNSMIYRGLREIVRENALQFLPAKSLLRFRGVCRDWNFLISTPFFAHTQSNSFRNVSGFFSQSPASMEPSFFSVDPSAHGVPDPSLSFLPEAVAIRSSSEGLLCCQGRTDYNAYYICNPVTKNWHKLTKSDNNHGSDPAVVLIFKPSVLNFTIEYTLVCAFPSELGGYEFEIYSSSNRSWRTSGEIYLGNLEIYPNSGAEASGVVYWRTNCRNGGILAFDLSKERSRILYGQAGAVLGAMDGKLCTVCANRRSVTVKQLRNAHTNTEQMHSNIVEAWETRGEYSFINLFVDNSYPYPEALMLTENNTALIRGGKALHLYDMKTQETRYLGTLESVYNKKNRIVSYVNSLVDL